MAKRKKTPPFIDLSEFKAKKIQWLFRPLIPYGMITVMEGDPGVGKSYLAMYLAATVSTGGTLPNGVRVTRGPVVYLSAEDDPAYTIRPRIEALGGDVSLIRVQADIMTLDDTGLAALFDEIALSAPDLIIIDPLFAYVSADKDMYRPNVIRQVLSRLRDIAEQGNTAVVLVRHLTKAKHEKAIYQGMGSMDVIGVARSAFLVTPHPEDKEKKLVLHIKHNISERGNSWVYALIPRGENEVPAFKWLGASDLTVDDLMSDNGDRSSALETAAAFLRDQLDLGQQPAAFMQERAAAAGISKRTLDRARETLSVIAEKKRRGWFWSLPSSKKGV